MQYLGKSGVVDAKRFMQIDIKFSDGRKWSFNPDLVQKHDETPYVKPTLRPSGSTRRMEAGANYKANDIVRVCNNNAEFERIQREAGLWQDWLRRVSH